MTGIRKKILLGVYVLLTTIILLYVLFPADAVRNHLANRINRNLSEVHVAIGSLGLRFPPALSFGDVTILRNNAVALSVDRLKISPRWRTLFSGRRAFSFTGRMYQGDISGSLWVAFENDGIDASASGSFSEIVLDRMPVIQEQARVGLTGTLSGSFQANASSMNPVTGSGHITATDCNLAYPVPLLNLEGLEFQRIETDYDFEGRNLDLQNGILEGTELSGTFDGSIYLESTIPESEMDLEISVIPLLSSTLSEINELRIRATGTFEDPNLTIVPAR